MATKVSAQIREIREKLGSGPVLPTVRKSRRVEEEPEPVKRQKVGAREAAMRRLREEQTRTDSAERQSD